MSTDDYNAMMLEPLERIENSLARAASRLEAQPKQPPRWTEKFAQDRRIGFAMLLAPVFAQAFDTPARADTWRESYGEQHDWPDFYRRIYSELFPGVKRLNLRKVLKEAARLQPQLEMLLEAQDAIRSQKKGK